MLKSLGIPGEQLRIYDNIVGERGRTRIKNEQENNRERGAEKDRRMGVGNSWDCSEAGQGRLGMWKSFRSQDCQKGLDVYRSETTVFGGK
jgi:hypothetical protein